MFHRLDESDIANRWTDDELDSQVESRWRNLRKIGRGDKGDDEGEKGRLAHGLLDRIDQEEDEPDPCLIEHWSASDASFLPYDIVDGSPRPHSG